VLQEQRHGSLTLALSGAVERCCAGEIAGIDGGTGGEKQLNHGDATGARRVRERHGAAAIACRERAAGSDHAALSSTDVMLAFAVS
jgi:hypothetical protein